MEANQMEMNSDIEQGTFTEAGLYNLSIRITRHQDLTTW
jgi:hypothetical protein